MKIANALLLIMSLVASALAKEPITVYLAGDSTMAQKQPDKRPETGWGEALQKFFDERRVRVENHAQNGDDQVDPADQPHRP